jgi:hypothetical protein
LANRRSNGLATDSYYRAEEQAEDGGQIELGTIPDQELGGMLHRVDDRTARGDEGCVVASSQGAVAAAERVVQVAAASCTIVCLRRFP